MAGLTQIQKEERRILGKLASFSDPRVYPKFGESQKMENVKARLQILSKPKKPNSFGIKKYEPKSK